MTHLVGRVLAALVIVVVWPITTALAWWDDHTRVSD